MANPSFLRHAAWVAPEDFVDPINIVGCGAVGSTVALLAAKMGVTRFHLWDADIVEPHNLPNQAYDTEHIGLRKVDALEQVLKKFNPEVQVVRHPEFFTSADKARLLGPLIIATDTMSARKDIYNAFHLNALIDYVFEIRLGFDYGELHIVDNVSPISCSSWFASLRDDSEVPDGPCNLRICSTLVNLVSSYAVHNLCAMYAAKRREEKWDYRAHTAINMNPLLSVVQFSETK